MRNFLLYEFFPMPQIRHRTGIKRPREMSIAYLLTGSLPLLFSLVDNSLQAA
jgi:hypothetical protein